MLRFYRKNWAAVGGFIFVLLAFMLGIFADAIPVLQRLTILLYMSLLFHQFEEYVFPGGFPASANLALFSEKETPVKYPHNEMSALFVNVVFAYPLYICGVIFYDCIWLGIFLAYFTITQVFMHCIVINRKFRSWYSPGCASALLVMVPIGIYYLCYIAGHVDFPSYYWWAALLAFPPMAFLTIMCPILVFRNKNTRFGFSDYEIEDFSIRKGIAMLRRK